MYGQIGSVIATRRSSRNSPSYVYNEWLEDGSSAIVGLSDAGEQLWRVALPGMADSLAGLPDGSVLARASGDHLVKISPAGTIAWEHAVNTQESVTGVSSSGVIYGGSTAGLTAWSSSDGSLLASTPFTAPSSTFTVRYNEQSTNPFKQPTECAPYNSATPPAPFSTPSQVATGFIGADGAYYLAYQTKAAVFVSDTRCSFPSINSDPLGGIPLIGKYTVQNDTYVVSFSPLGLGTPVLAARDILAVGSNSSISDPEDTDPVRCLAGFAPCTLLPTSSANVIPQSVLERVGPDSKGGVLISRTVQPNQGFASEMLTRVRAGAVQYDVANPTYAGGLAAIAVADNGTSLWSRGQITAVDPDTGAALWETTQTAGFAQLLSATDDDGILYMVADYNVGAPVTRIVRLDAGGELVSEDDVPGDLTGSSPIFAGANSIVFNDGQAVSMLALPSVAVEPGVAFPVPGAGSASATAAVQPIKVSEFVDTAQQEKPGLVGFDPGIDSDLPAVMVPLQQSGTGGSKKVKVRVFTTDPVTFESSNTSLFTVDAQQASVPSDGHDHLLTLVGANAGTAVLRPSSGAPAVPVLHVDVKAYQAPILRFVTFNNPTPNQKNIPDQSTLLTELNQNVFARQANLHFTVEVTSDSFNYDSDGDGALHYDTQIANGKKVECYSCVATGLSAEQTGLIRHYSFQFQDGNWVPNANALWAQESRFHLFVFAVKAFSSDGQDSNGFSSLNNNISPAFIRADRNDKWFNANATAHEIAHMLGLPHNRRDDALGVKDPANNGNYLMKQFNNPPNKPRRLTRAEWNVLNPSPEGGGL